MDERILQPELAIRKAVRVLRDEMPKKLRKYERVSEAAFLNHTDPREQWGLSYAAAGCDRRPVVALLAELHADLDLPDRADGASGAHIAAQKGYTHMVKLLATLRADVHRRAPDGGIPLHDAAACGHDATVRLLLGLRSPVNAQNERGITPLWNAASYDRSTTAAILLESKADVDLGNANGATPLLVASQEGALRTVRVLLDHRCSTNKARHDGWSPLRSARVEGHHQIAALLKENGAIED